jgi:DNA-binding transcriptional LysR family regulator
MRIEQLEYVTAVAQFGSFRRAAEELHLSQPALSESVRNLERELGIDILDRGRSGTKISEAGRELMPHMLTAIDAIERLRQVAGEQNDSSRVVHLGTVTAATVPLLTPTIREFGETHPTTQVEVVTAQQARIHTALLEGRMDLGLVNYLEGEEVSPEFDTTELLRGRPVVCVKADSPLAGLASVQPADLVREPLIAMRPGYVMHRYLTRLFAGEALSFSFSADGAEMGKLMVAQGLGAAVLPDYSVAGDPLELSGTITYREIEGDDTAVLLVIQRRRSSSMTRAVGDLHRLFVEHAQAHMALV